MAVKDNNTKKKQKVVSDKRNINLKWFSIGSVIILVAIILVFNILFDSILGKTLSFDLSATGQNAISQVTEDYINSLPADAKIRVVGLFDEPSNIKDTYYEYIIPLLENYQSKSNGRISVEYINPESYPAIINELDPQGMFDLKSGTYAVAYNGRVISINPIDCFSYDQELLTYYGYYRPTSNMVENTFTNAIVNLTRGFQSKAYFVNVSQTDPHTQMTNILNALGCESLDLYATEDFAIPADCDLLIISGIYSDITESMAQQMIDYIHNGGKLLVAVGFNPENTSERYLNLNLVLNEVNLNLDSTIISENNPDYQLGSGNNASFYSNVDIFQDYGSFTNAATLRTSFSRPVREYDNPYSYIQVAPILCTSSNASASEVASDGTVNRYANEGLYYVGYHATFVNTSTPPDVYVFGTMALTSDNYISQYGYNDSNVIFIRNVVRDMLKVENSVIVESKTLYDYSLNPTKVTANSVNTLMVVLIIVIPAAFVISGVIIYSKRKNL